jgi:phosphate transport system permease protein
MSTRTLEWIIERLLFLCAALSVLTTAGIIVVLAVETFAFLREVSIVEFLTGTEWTPLFANQRFGVLPLVAGTVLVSAIAMTVALPMGLLSAIYLSEYAPSTFRRIVKPILELLAGVPTVVYGYFALTFVTPLLQRFLPGLSGFNALSPGLVMGLMILPLVSSLSEDALHSVPNGLREGAYALGATRWQVVRTQVLPMAIPGILTGTILALSRAVGETAPLIMIGGVAFIASTPNSVFDRFTVLPLQIFNWISRPQPEFHRLAAAGILVLLGILLTMNAAAILLRNRYQRRH